MCSLCQAVLSLPLALCLAVFPVVSSLALLCPIGAAGEGMDLVLGFRLFALAVAFASGLAGLLCACGSLPACLSVSCGCLRAADECPSTTGLYADWAAPCCYMAVMLTFVAFLIDSLSRKTGRAGPRAQRLGCATAKVAWLGLVVYAVLMFRGVTESEEHCQDSNFKPSPDYTVLPDDGSFGHRWNYPRVDLVECATTEGLIHLQLRRDWAPKGVARFLELVTDGFFSDSPFFDVEPDVSCEFGISKDAAANARWSTPIADDRPPTIDRSTPAGIPFQRGTLSFATSAADTRASHMVFSLREAAYDPAKPWETPIGVVTETTVATLSKIHSTHDPYPKPDPARIQEGDGYLAIFPQLDYIQNCVVADESTVTVPRCGPSILPFVVASSVVFILSSVLYFESASVVDENDAQKRAVRAP